jgi:hypothetical protein
VYTTRNVERALDNPAVVFDDRIGDFPTNLFRSQDLSIFVQTKGSTKNEAGVDGTKVFFYFVVGNFFDELPGMAHGACEDPKKKDKNIYILVSLTTGMASRTEKRRPFHSVLQNGFEHWAKRPSDQIRHDWVNRVVPRGRVLLASFVE